MAASTYRSLSTTLRRVSVPSIRSQTLCGRRNASDQSSPAEPFNDLESTSLTDSAVPEDVAKSFDPIKNSSRTGKLPKSRYVLSSIA